ncbi:LRR receptor-like serine/threonine-protein kinase EFR [Cryptomeria japonica]|uniref:LRR receptor-like serine/threonine-protein kinase EFR n=1 Tax=Cryptomeria japonica TaxID=3369 RepID=UPI0027DA388E|nr:LRR receptor-like serine/threonine-protein kinase EFR [Cryptomeria japonica]
MTKSFSNHSREESSLRIVLNAIIDVKPCDSVRIGCSILSNSGRKELHVIQQEIGYNCLIPLELSRLSDLQFLSLSSNQLVSGSTITIPILTALQNCTRLNKLWIDDNQLTGYLPEELATNLSLLVLNGNKITGSIPSLIANLTNLGDLYLSYNLLTGRIPSSLRSLGKLQRLLLDNNKLEGNIPSEIGEIKSLGELSLSHNMFSGEIPNTIGRLLELTHLVLNHNQLSGKVPSSLGKCYKLQLLDLSNNQFRGRIPHEVASLPNLQFYFNLSRNSFHGSLPLEIGKMIHVQAIDVSANRLQGQIPATLGSCEQLEYLQLSSNELQGPIPNSLSGLKGLVSMDLSSNSLSGLIPVSLKSLNVLQYLNLSFNNLSGEVPNEGVFKNFTAASFMGNMFLCGEWMQLPACAVGNIQSKYHENRIRILGPMAGTITFLFFCLLILGLIYRRRKIKSDVPSDIVPLKLMDDSGISYHEIINATDGFNQKNYLGTGSSGSVYKGIMGDGREAAFKLLNLQNEEAGKSFSRECKVLAEVRHRNLVKIISFCLEFGRKILVLEFMSRGNLETFLHSNGNTVSFIEILNIAIDVIHGLEYLHHDSFQQVIHCDIKPSNILMDENMTAHIADFGIARIICGSDTINSGFASSLTLKGSVGYIAPGTEYGVGGKVSTKGDIYSYGIMLLEMVTGKSPTNHMFVEGLNLHKWVSLHFDDKLGEIINMRMMKDGGEFKINQWLIPFLRTALECSKESPNERPTAREVARILESIRRTHFEVLNS